jgi:hypothetical protein
MPLSTAPDQPSQADRCQLDGAFGATAAEVEVFFTAGMTKRDKLPVIEAAIARGTRAARRGGCVADRSSSQMRADAL